MTAIRQGTIVNAWTPDPQGGNDKCRPLVVITPSSEISDETPLVLVAITGEFSSPLLPDEVLLPFHAQGKCSTGLTKKCAAKCSWRVSVLPSKVETVRGYLKSKDLQKVMAAVKKCR